MHFVQNVCGLWADTGPFQSLMSVEKAIYAYARHESNSYEWVGGQLAGGQLRVNTSLFVW